MKRVLYHSDIRDISADALIYSTNVQLMLSGGVGACLLERYGTRFQDALLCCVDSSGRQLAEVGDVFKTSLDNLPWKVVFHTIATDPLYHTEPSVVRNILDKCLRECSQSSQIKSVVMSPLGAGYGDMPFPLFLDIVTDLISQDLALEEVGICCNDDDFYEELSRHSESSGLEWINKKNESG